MATIYSGQVWRALMARRNYYLLCALADLKAFGSSPPVSKQELLGLVVETGGPSDLVEVLLLSDDLLQREAVLAGEIEPDQADVVALSLPQAKDEQPLPYFLLPEEGEEAEDAGGPIVGDVIWQRYFRYTARIARRARSRFLSAWVGYEVGLRNAMVVARAETLSLDPKPYLVAPELGNPDLPFDDAVTEWSAASNPLAALEVLDKVRWHWLIRQEPWYRFNDDEVAAYTAKLMILDRWHRISETKDPS